MQVNIPKNKKDSVKFCSDFLTQVERNDLSFRNQQKKLTL